MMEDKLLSIIGLFRQYGFFNSFIGSPIQIAESISSKSESSYFGNIKDLLDEPLFEQIALSYDKEICWFIEDANAYFFADEVSPDMYKAVFKNLSLMSKGVFTPQNIEIKECGYCEGRDKRLMVNYTLNGQRNELVFCSDGWSLILTFIEEINETIQHTAHSFQYIMDSYGACFIYFVSDEQKKFLLEMLGWKFIRTTDYWSDKAMYYKETGSLLLVEECFQKAIKGNNINAFVQYGIFLKEQDKYNEAKAMFEYGKSVLNEQKPPWDNDIWWREFIQNQIEELKKVN